MYCAVCIPICAANDSEYDRNFSNIPGRGYGQKKMVHIVLYSSSFQNEYMVCFVLLANEMCRYGQKKGPIYGTFLKQEYNIVQYFDFVC